MQERWKSLLVFEAPIDPMSFIALYLNDWKALNYLSLDGVGVKVLEGFPYKCKDIKTIYICTDLDKVGNDGRKASVRKHSRIYDGYSPKPLRERLKRSPEARRQAT